jgi:hypothetical protein
MILGEARVVPDADALRSRLVSNRPKGLSQDVPISGAVLSEHSLGQ